MVRNNLGAAMQGLAVIPLFAGFDLDATDPSRVGRIFSFDVAGGSTRETGTTLSVRDRCSPSRRSRRRTGRA